MLVISKKDYEIEEEVGIIGNNGEDLYKFTMKITPDEMARIKELIFNEDVIKTQKQVDKLKNENKYSEVEKLEEELGNKALKDSEELYKIWFKEHLEKFKEISGEYKFEEIAYQLYSFFINAFVKQKITPLNTTITDLAKFGKK